ncbi:hypothetical protein Tco_1315722 [Tanacetum coccineum]
MQFRIRVFQKVRNQKGKLFVPGKAYQNGNGNVVAARAEVRPRRRDVAYLQTQLLIAQKEEAGIQLQAEEFDLMAAAADLDEIEEVNANCILMANLQQASTSGTQTDKAPVYDLDGSAKCVEQGGGTVEQHSANVEETRAYHESLFQFRRLINLLANEADESLAKNKALELEIERLLRAVVSQDIMSIVQNNFVVDTSNLQTELDHTKERFENSYNDMHQKIERLQAQLGDQKGKSKDTPYASNTLDPLPQKLENENVELEFQNKLHDTIYENAKLRAQLFDKVSDQKDTTKGTSTNTKFANQSTERKPFLQSLRNQFVVRQPNAFKSERQNASKTHIPQKVDKMHDLSNPVTSNSVPTTEESKVVDNDKVIAPGMFRINPFKNSREEQLVPNKPTKESVRTHPITVSQPHVIIKKVVNSDSNGFSSTGVDITTKTRRP